MIKRKHIYLRLLASILILITVEWVCRPNIPQPADPPKKKAKVIPQYEYISPYPQISHYDEYFRLAADSIEIDWLFLAAVAYTESRFDSTAISGAGAKGVMQMMPRTLQGLGVPDSLHADNLHNIHASARYLKDLFHKYRYIKNPEEKMNFVLASYNAGYGHILDAMRIAQKEGLNRHKWKGNVDSCLVKKSLPEYYSDSITCRNGEFKDWQQTLSFVKKVDRHWRRFTGIQHSYTDSINIVIESDTLKKILEE